MPRRSTRPVSGIPIKYGRALIGKALAKLWQLDGRHVVPKVDCNGVQTQCAITLEPIVEPVMILDGSVYELNALQVWLADHDTSPCTNIPLMEKTVLLLNPFQEILEAFLLHCKNEDAARGASLKKAVQSAEARSHHAGPRQIREIVNDLEELVNKQAKDIDDLSQEVARANRVMEALRKTEAALRIQAFVTLFMRRRRAEIERARRCTHAASIQRAWRRFKTRCALSKWQSLASCIQDTFEGRIEHQRRLRGERFRQLLRERRKCDKDSESSQGAPSKRNQVLAPSSSLSRDADSDAKRNAPILLFIFCPVLACVAVAYYLIMPGLLTVSAAMGNVPMLKTFMRIVPDFDAHNCLHIAAAYNNLPVVSFLVEASADVNRPQSTFMPSRGLTPLMFAAKDGHLEVLRMLVAAGAETNRPASDGITPLFFAISQGHVETVRFLLDASADVNQCPDDNATALFLASMQGHASIAKLLVRAGVAINKPFEDRSTPLLIASQVGHSDVVRYLLRSRAAKDKPRQNSVTPLMVAANMGHLDVVHLLVKAGARKDLLTDDGKTSLDLAVLGKHTKVLHFLVHAGLPPGPCVKIVLFFMHLKMPWTAWIVLFFCSNML